MSIEIKNVSHVYMKKTSLEHTALKNISLTIEEGTLTAIAGHTGSGKSTLATMLNGLLSPTEGEILIDGKNISQDLTRLSSKERNAIKKIRQSVGLVFQYPEHQLFEETVEKEIAFAPKNFGCDETEILQRVKDAMQFVNLDYETYKNVSPFTLSGGEMRRVAIAGILAMKPKYLVLDEPTAGLDPKMRNDLLQKIFKLHQSKKMTVIFISHNMENIARLAQRVIVLNHGEVFLDGAPKKIFFDEKLSEAGLKVPVTVELLKALKNRGFAISDEALTLDETVKTIQQALKRKK